MPAPISPADLAALIDEADAAARRLHRKLALPAADLDDLRQDLLIDLICRLPGFDERRGSIGAFANIILRNQCARIAMRHHRQRRALGGTVLSLDAPVAGSSEPLGCLLAEANGLAAWHGQNRDTQTDIQIREAVHSVLARLPEADRRFCCALAAEGFGSRSVLYRRIAELRPILTAYGLGSSWADLAAADNWPGGSPDREFSKSDPGTNAVIVRTGAGLELLQSAEQAGAVTLEYDLKPDDMSHYQLHQMRKKYAVWPRLDGIEDAGHFRPAYQGLRLQELAAELPAEVNETQRAGTCKRIQEGKVREGTPRPWGGNS